MVDPAYAGNNRPFGLCAKGFGQKMCHKKAGQVEPFLYLVCPNKYIGTGFRCTLDKWHKVLVEKMETGENREMKLKICVDDECFWTSHPENMPKNYPNVDFIFGISDECLSKFFPGAEVRNIALKNRSP